MLALVPAGMLVLVVLAALAVDSAVAYLGQQQLHDALSAAANNAVAAALEDRAFYQSGALSIDPVAAGRVVCSTVRAQGDSGLHRVTVAMSVSGDAIEVTGAATVDEVFGRSLPGFAHRSVRSTAAAVLSKGSGGIAPNVRFGAPTPLQCP